MHWYATPTASLGHMYVVPVINKAYATARVVGQARLLVFISFIMIVWSLATFTKPSILSEAQAVCQLTISHQRWLVPKCKERSDPLWKFSGDNSSLN